jgi:hypothetical protein
MAAIEPTKQINITTSRATSGETIFCSDTPNQEPTIVSTAIPIHIQIEISGVCPEAAYLDMNDVIPNVKKYGCSVAAKTF